MNNKQENTDFPIENVDKNLDRATSTGFGSTNMFEELPDEYYQAMENNFVDENDFFQENMMVDDTSMRGIKKNHAAENAKKYEDSKNERNSSIDSADVGCDNGNTYSHNNSFHDKRQATPQKENANSSHAKNEEIDEVSKYRQKVSEAVADEINSLPTEKKKEALANAGDGDGDDPKKPKKFTEEFIMQCCYNKDKGNGILFSEIFANKYACLSKDYWLKFIGPYWEEVDVSTVQHDVEEVVHQYAKLKTILSRELADKKDDEAATSKINAKIKKLRSSIDRLHTVAGVRDCLDFSRANEKSTLINGDLLDTDPYILCCENGIVDMRSGLLRQGLAEDYITKKCNASWQDLETKAPMWQQMVHEILGENDDITHYFQKLLGMAMCGAVSEKIFIVLFGEDGDSGKTTIFEILLKIMNKYVSPMPVEMLLDQRNPKNPDSPTPSIMSLRNKRLCYASEPGEGRKFSIENIKLMSGNDSLTGRNPWDKDLTSFTPTHTLFVLTNHKMRASAHDQAFWSRLRLIECPYSFVPNPDPKNKKQKQRKDGLIDAIVSEEASGVIAWIVKGYMLYLSDGLEPPEAIKEMTSQYRREEDFIADFIEACLQPSIGERISAADLYNVFEEWYKENYSSKPISATRFGKIAPKSIEKVKAGGKVWYKDYEIKPEAMVPKEGKK